MTVVSCTCCHVSGTCQQDCTGTCCHDSGTCCHDSGTCHQDSGAGCHDADGDGDGGSSWLPDRDCSPSYHNL